MSISRARTELRFFMRVKIRKRLWRILGCWRNALKIREKLYEGIRLATGSSSIELISRVQALGCLSDPFGRKAASLGMAFCAI